MGIELDFQGPVAVFPLPNAVLFPGSLLPLHVFEPRYRTMVADAMGGDRLIAIALLASGWEEDYQGAPEIHPIATLGRVIRHTLLPDGRSNILLEGLARVRPLTEHPPDPYRTAVVEVIDERLTLESLEEASALAREVHELVLDLYFAAPPLFGSSIAAPSDVITAGRYFDRIADALRVDPRIRQALLDEVDLVPRGRKLRAVLEQAIEVVRRQSDDNDEADDDADDSAGELFDD